MSKLQQNLRENKNKIKRAKFLSAIDSSFSDFLSNAEFSSDLSCLKFAAFPSWDDENKAQTKREEVANWNNFRFKTWQELIAMMEKFQKIKNYIGWFFIDADGPYYRVSVNSFLSHIKSISTFGTSNKHYNFGWVGSEDDVGIIIEYNNSALSDKKFTISVWGI